MSDALPEIAVETGGVAGRVVGAGVDVGLGGGVLAGGVRLHATPKTTDPTTKRRGVGSRRR
jgi:hypothetical protein